MRAAQNFCHIDFSVTEEKRFQNQLLVGVRSAGEES